MSRNQYEGQCYLCNLVVKAGTGHFERIKGGLQRWRVKHANVPGDGRVTCLEAAKAFADEALEAQP
jgi:hypothetical protein